MWSWSLRLTRAKATGRSAIGSVASNRVNRPRCNSSMHNVPENFCRTSLTMLSQVELTTGCRRKAVIDETLRQLPGRSHAAYAGQGACSTLRPILEDAFEDGVTNLHGRHSRLFPWVEHRGGQERKYLQQPQRALYSA